jgi:UPF0271 protein
VGGRLNIDLGELPGEPEELYSLAHLVNLACGGHAGDGDTVRRAVALARRHGALVTAHPSYPDRDSFGRRSLAIEPEALRESVRAQCALLAVAAAAEGLRVDHVKPHGALYHDAWSRPAIARALVAGAAEGLGLHPSALWLLGAPGLLATEPPQATGPAAGADAGRAAGGAVAGTVRLSIGGEFLVVGGLLAEGFADRAYDAAGHLVPRSQAGSLLTDPDDCVRQAIALQATRRFQTLCVHGDTPGAVAIARAVRAAIA